MVKHLGRIGKFIEKIELNLSFTNCFKYLYIEIFICRYSMSLYRMIIVIFFNFPDVFDISLMIEYLIKIN